MARIATVEDLAKLTQAAFDKIAAVLTGEVRRIASRHKLGGVHLSHALKRAKSEALINKINEVTLGCGRGELEGVAGGAIGGGIASVFLGPEALAVGAAGGGVGGCVVGGVEALLGIK